jgi:hypothetical protein
VIKEGFIGTKRLCTFYAKESAARYFEQEEAALIANRKLWLFNDSINGDSYQAHWESRVN